MSDRETDRLREARKYLNWFRMCAHLCISDIDSPCPTCKTADSLEWAIEECGRLRNQDNQTLREHPVVQKLRKQIKDYDEALDLLSNHANDCECHCMDATAIAREVREKYK